MQEFPEDNKSSNDAERKRRSYFPLLVLGFAVLLHVIKVSIRASHTNNLTVEYTFGYWAADFIFTLVIHSLVLLLIAALVGSFIRIYHKVRIFSVFCWLLLAAALFDLSAECFKTFIVIPRAERALQIMNSNPAEKATQQAPQEPLQIIDSTLPKQSIQQGSPFVESSLAHPPYVDKKYGFSIALPQNWETKPGAAQHTILKTVTKDKHGRLAIITVSAYELKTHTDLSKYSDAQLNKLLDLQLEGTDYEILESLRCKLDSREAFCTKADVKAPAVISGIYTLRFVVSGNALLVFSGVMDRDSDTWQRKVKPVIQASLQSIRLD